MELINFQDLINRKSSLKDQWFDTKKPFPYLIYDGFFTLEGANHILGQYPDINSGDWDGTTYINQRNKFTLTKFGSHLPLIQQAFAELNSKRFLTLLEEITGINALLADEELFGGGLHQSTKGAFLDVHVDFNIHERSKYHRRMNALVYMNKEWKPEYNGYLELWDMQSKRQLEYIAPLFNRLVIFETNEVSYHGHPKPLNTPNGYSRKSLAVYYYTQERPDHEITEAHNTIYVNTEGATGLLKNIKSGLKAVKERIIPK